MSNLQLADNGAAAFTEAMADADEIIRQRGRVFLVAWHTALRSLRLYPLENDQVQRALDELHAAAGTILRSEEKLEVRISGDFIFLNGTRLRHELQNYAVFGYVLKLLRECCLGAVVIDKGIGRRDWQVFLSLLLKMGSDDPDPLRATELQRRLSAADVLTVLLEPPSGLAALPEFDGHGKGAAKRTYERAVAVTKNLMGSVRMGHAANMKRVKRALQGIVDQVLKNEVSILGLTTLRDYDEYTFGHSVNVCILSVAIGKRIGLTKLQLYDLGLAALLHDIGKSRIPHAIVTKPDGLTSEEWHIMQTHPGLGALALFGFRGGGDIPYRAVIVAHEHHQRTDLRGYPKAIRSGALSMYSKIVAVADCYDATTSRRRYRNEPIAPDQILREMWESRGHGFDPLVVKALINLLGIYPVGTCVILDTLELAVVHSANPDTSELHRPVVRIVSTAEGFACNTGELADLAEMDLEGNYRRSIIKVVDPEQYGVNCAEYFM